MLTELQTKLEIGSACLGSRGGLTRHVLSPACKAIPLSPPQTLTLTGSRLHKVGLLPRCNYQQVPFAYRMYSQDDETGWEQSKAFKKAFSIDVDVEFVGVW